MYAHLNPTFDEAATPAEAPCVLSPGELDAMEQRAQGVGGSYIHVPTVLEMAQRDVPALLAEVRRLRAWCEERLEAAACVGG